MTYAVAFARFVSTQLFVLFRTIIGCCFIHIAYMMKVPLLRMTFESILPQENLKRSHPLGPLYSPTYVLMILIGAGARLGASTRFMI